MQPCFATVRLNYLRAVWKNDHQQSNRLNSYVTSCSLLSLCLLLSLFDQDKDQRSLDMDTAKSMLALLLGRTWPLFPVFQQFLEVNPLVSCGCMDRLVKSALQLLMLCKHLSWSYRSLTHFYLKAKQVYKCLSMFFSSTPHSSPLVSLTAVKVQGDEQGPVV